MRFYNSGKTPSSQLVAALTKSADPWGLAKAPEEEAPAEEEPPTKMELPTTDVLPVDRYGSVRMQRCSGVHLERH